MNFEDIKERFKEEFAALAARVQESSAFIQLMERYQNLSPDGQKVALFGSVVLSVLLLFSVPMTIYMSSGNAVEEAELKKDVMRDLFRVNREAGILPPLPMPITPGEIQNRIQGILRESPNPLQPAQIVSVTEFEQKVPKMPTTLQQRGVSAQLSKLNVDQLVTIGQKLQGIGVTTKMVGLEVRANREDSKYFDVVFKLVNFALPPEAPSTPGAKAGSKRGGG